MINKILNKIYKQNQWYDSLSEHNRRLRFLLFITPMLAGFTIDLYWVVLFSGSPMFTYLVWGLMALWRIPYVMRGRQSH